MQYSVEEAPKHMREILDLVKKGETVFITRDGRIVAKFIPVTESSNAPDKVAAPGPRGRPNNRGSTTSPKWR